LTAKRGLAVLIAIVSYGYVALPLAAAVASPYTCMEASAEQLLERHVDALSVTGVKVEKAVAELSEMARAPMSFIQAEPEETVSLDLREITVRQALDAIVARAPRYRYGVVSDRLVIYPRDSKWELRLDDVYLGPGPRARITKELADEIRWRLPTFSDLHDSWRGFAGSGKPHTYQDVVLVVWPGSILELLVQLLGSSPSTYFFVVRQDGLPGTGLSTSPINQLQSLQLTAPTTTLRRRDQAVQLKLIGVLEYGGVVKNLTAGACGAFYKVSDDQVLAVDQDGLVTARGSGIARVSAEIERSVAEVTFRVNLPADRGNNESN